MAIKSSPESRKSSQAKRNPAPARVGRDPGRKRKGSDTRARATAGRRYAPDEEQLDDDAAHGEVDEVTARNRNYEEEYEDDEEEEYEDDEEEEYEDDEEEEYEDDEEEEYEDDEEEEYEDDEEEEYEDDEEEEYEDDEEEEYEDDEPRDAPGLTAGSASGAKRKSGSKISFDDIGDGETEPEQLPGSEQVHSEVFHRIKQQIFSVLLDTINIAALNALPDDEARDELRDTVIDLIEQSDISLPISEQEDLLDGICDDILGYGPLEPLLNRDDIADIMVNGADRTFIEVDGRVRKTSIRFKDNQQLMNVCQRIVSQVGRRVDESSPICDARLIDGSRVNVIAPPLAIDGPALTIRKFKKDKLTLDQLVGFASISPEGAELLKVIGRCRANVLVSGGTGSGKTTLLNCLTAYIEKSERIVTCEDTAELQLQQPHVVRLETRPPNLEGEGEITMRDLVKNCLRMRPERIIVGEVRGPEAFDLLQAMNTGHDGSMGTLHANSPREAISRMESMITTGGYGLPTQTIRDMIVSSVEIIVQAMRLRDGSRRITHITEVIGMEGSVPTLQDILVFNITGEDDDGKLVGSHQGTGIIRPKLAERAGYYGLGEVLSSALENSAI